MTKNVKEGLGAWNVCPAPSTHSRREWESFCIFYFSRSHLHFPPAAHFSCTGPGRGEDPKAQRGVCDRRTGVNQPLAGKTPNRRGARGPELPETPTSQFRFANLWIQKRRGLHAQVCGAPQCSPVLFPLLSGSLNLPVSDFLTLPLLRRDVSHSCHQMKARPHSFSVS